MSESFNNLHSDNNAADSLKGLYQSKLEQLRVLIQKQPIKFFCFGVVAGLLVAVFFRLFIAIAFLGICVLSIIYLLNKKS